jgi:ferredoxin/flavodoxin---NADP+ reductase
MKNIMSIFGKKHVTVAFKRILYIFVLLFLQENYVNKHTVTMLRHLTETTFVLQLERRGLQFHTGQFVVLRRPKTIVQRAYTIYSGEKDHYVEVLVKEISEGKVTPRLRKLKAGDILELDGPFGFFRFNPHLFPMHQFLFVATGTGISPYHSFVQTYPNLEYHIIHGVRYGKEAYEHHHFDKSRITLCTSADKTGKFCGRVTDYLKTLNIPDNTLCFLCGNNAMVLEAYDLLTEKGVPVHNIYSEVHYH